jgi:hypothetical protein
VQRSLHIVAACTELKSRPVPVERRLRTYIGRNGSASVSRWWRVLAAVDDAERVTATQLYQGPYWSSVIELCRTTADAGWRVQLSIASAGFGLVPASTRVSSYAATFTPGHADSVPDQGFSSRHLANRTWWRELNAHNPSGPRVGELSGLIDRARDAYLIVVGSPWYVGALAADLRAVMGRIGPDRIAIVTSQLPMDASDLEPSWLPSMARLQQVVGGGISSLHPRVARELMRSVSPTQFETRTARAVLSRLNAGLVPTPRIQRSKSTPIEVLDFIRGRLSQTPGASATALLREFRDKGRAFEQRRFHDVYQEAKRS